MQVPDVTGEDAITEYLVAYLEADTTLMGMLNGPVAPEVIWGSELGPLVRIDRLDGDDLYVIGLYRVWVDTTYHIRAVQQWRGSGRPDRTDVNAIGDRLDELLHGHEAISGSYQFHVFREEPTPSPAVVEPGGELWLQSGGIFWVRANAA
jgi:hypothetical protein